jgi:hypothetical protein
LCIKTPISSDFGTSLNPNRSYRTLLLAYIIFNFTILKTIDMKVPLIIKSAILIFSIFINKDLPGQPGEITSSKGELYNITSYGAKPDEKILNTKAIQKAIDECSVNGGGTVYVPSGTFFTGSIILKSHVTLSLSKNSVLLASGKISDYNKDPEKQSFILIDGVEDVSVVGEGIIDGQGNLFTVSDDAPDRPYLMLVNESKKISIENVTLRNSAKWTLRLYGEG